jgi:polyisoprenoid-binding protein YceI
MRRCLALLSLSLTSAAAPAAPEVFVLDPEHSFVHFEVLHFGTSTLIGRIGPIRGAVSLDRQAGRGYVGLTLDPSQVATGVPLLDRRLQAADLLDTAAHPQAWFVASRMVFERGRLVEVRGEFTLRGVSRPLSLHAERFGCRRDAAPAPGTVREVCGGDFSASLRRSDFGVDFGLPFVADEVRLKIQVEGWRP